MTAMTFNDPRLATLNGFSVELTEAKQRADIILMANVGFDELGLRTRDEDDRSGPGADHRVRGLGHLVRHL